MKTDELYVEFWNRFHEARLGPMTHTNDEPTIKHGEQAYRKFQSRFGLGFMLVATASVRDDRICAQFFTGNLRGRAFLIALKESGSLVETRGGHQVRIHVNGTDGKLELAWHEAGLNDRSFWPVHFLWLRTSLHELAETFGPTTINLSEGA